MSPPLISAESYVGKIPKSIGNLQQWLIGTYHGVSRDQLQGYLDEFVFRHNRRRQPMAAFQTLLGLGTGRKPTTINKYAVPWTFPLVRRRPTPSYCVLLKQPDKHKLTKLGVAQ